MGIASAITAIGAGLASLLEGLFSLIDLRAPLLAAVGLLLIGLVLFTAFKSGKELQTES